MSLRLSAAWMLLRKKRVPTYIEAGGEGLGWVLLFCFSKNPKFFSKEIRGVAIQSSNAEKNESNRVLFNSVLFNSVSLILSLILSAAPGCTPAR